LAEIKFMGTGEHFVWRKTVARHCVFLLSTCLLATIVCRPAAADETAPASGSGPSPTQGSDPSPGANQGPQLHAQTAAPPAISPYQLKLQYTGEAWDNAAGGLHTGTVYMQNIFANLRVDADKAFGWAGGRFSISGFYNTSRSLDVQYTGAAQDPSVIDTSGVRMVRLYQAYYDQRLGSTDLLFGVYDPETEFGTTRPMDIFFNGAYAWTTTLDQSGQQGLNGPSTYPNTALGFRAKHQFDDDWSAQATVLDGMSDSPDQLRSTDFQFKSKYGIFGIGELDYTPSTYTKVMAGYWGYTAKFVTQDQFNADGTNRQTYGSNGGYVGGAVRLYTIEGRRGLDGFANLGVADSTVNQIDRSLAAGLTFTGPLAARPTDKLGLAVGIASDGNPYRQAQADMGAGTFKYETNFELTYRATITSWLTLQPDIQYWVHPNFEPTLKNDFLFGLHFEIGHWFGL
jgi:porin